MNQKVYNYLEALSKSFRVTGRELFVQFENGLSLNFIVKGQKFFQLLPNRQSLVLDEFELCEKLKLCAFGDPEAIAIFDKLEAKAVKWGEGYN